MKKMSKKIIIPVIVIITAALALLLLNRPAATGRASMPAYATGSAFVKEAYAFAMDNPEALDGVNCYCGCMQHSHSGRIHKRGLLDCFMKEDGSFERHASECDMCLRDAMQVKQMFESGSSKEQIKQAIDSKYAKQGDMHAS